MLRAKETGATVEVKVFERDTEAHGSERGGYSIRMGEDGIAGLKACMDESTYAELRDAHGHGEFELYLIGAS